MKMGVRTQVSTFYLTNFIVFHFSGHLLNLKGLYTYFKKLLLIKRTFITIAIDINLNLVKVTLTQEEINSKFEKKRI